MRFPTTEVSGNHRNVLFSTITAIYWSHRKKWSETIISCDLDDSCHVHTSHNSKEHDQKHTFFIQSVRTLLKVIDNGKAYAYYFFDSVQFLLRPGAGSDYT